MFQHFKPIVLRPAIAMIELIFAIVIIGITLLSAPMIIGQSVQSINTNLQQESIAAAASHINLILTHHWDENDTSNIAGDGILRVVAGNPALSVVNRDINYTRQYNALGTGFENASNILGSEGGDLDDIDDFNAQAYNLTLYGAENVTISDNEGDYIDSNITMATTIAYGIDVTSDYSAQTVVFNNPFRISNASTDIKLITVRLTSASGVLEYSKNISLSAFSCNIGASRVIPLVNMRTLP